MRRPMRQAMLWLLLALAGGIGAYVSFGLGQGQGWAVALGMAALAALAFGGVMGPLALLSARGEAKLRRGEGGLESWTVPPQDWDAYRAFDTQRGAQHPGLLNHFTPRAAEGRAAEVLFGRRAVIVDDTYHPLRRFAIPELMRVGWHAPPDAPECLEFSLIYPGGRYGPPKWMALRVPVPLAAREAGVRVYHHFHALLPKPRPSLASRRPKLVIGGGLAVTLTGAAVAGIAWWLHPAGRPSELLEVAIVLGIGIAIFGAIVTIVVGLVVAMSRWKKAKQ